jgi:hypothetical protein
MTIISYIVRIIVAIGFVMGSLLTWATGMAIKEDLIKDKDIILSKCIFCLFATIFIICTYLMGVIK